MIRYAIAGFGSIAEKRLAREGFHNAKHALLAGVFDRDPQRRAAAEAYGAKWYDSLEELCADPGIDAVIVAVNNSGHAGTALAALNAGKHVLVEKPLATTLSDAEAMAETARRQGRVLSVDHMMLHNARNRSAARLIQSGGIGTVNDFRVHMEFAFGYTPAEAASWRCSSVAELGGPVGDVASHCFYVTEALIGRRIAALAAVYYPKWMATAAEDGALIRLRLENGVEGSIAVSFCDRRGGARETSGSLGYEFYGDNGVLRGFGTMFQFSGLPEEPIRQRLELDRGGVVRELPPESPVENIYCRVIEEHAAAILSGASGNAAEGVRNLRLCLAVHESARHNGRLIPIAPASVQRPPCGQH